MGSPSTPSCQKPRDHTPPVFCDRQPDNTKALKDELKAMQLATVKKEKRTKFIRGNHQLYYDSTAPSVAVRDEMAKAKARMVEQQRQKQREDVEKLTSVVDTIAQPCPASCA